MKLLTRSARALRKIERKTSPFSNDVDATRRAHWVKPELVVEVRFSEWTRDGYLRQPAYPRPARRIRRRATSSPRFRSALMAEHAL